MLLLHNTKKISHPAPGLGEPGTVQRSIRSTCGTWAAAGR